MKTIPLTRRGVPSNAEDWTTDDWRDLHRATERAIKRIAKRHATARNALAAPTTEGRG